MAVAEDGKAEERRLRPPSLFLMLAEARGLFELNSSLLLSPLLLRAPKGDGHPVLAREGRFLVASFHPELTGDTRLHELFLESVREANLVRA